MKKVFTLIFLSAALLLSACSETSQSANFKHSTAAEISRVDSSKEYVSVSAGAIFYDYLYTKDIPNSDISQALVDKAAEAALASEYYDSASIPSYRENYPDFFVDNKMTAKLNCAFTDDFDNDGREESFILVDMPVDRRIKSVLVFADADENMTVFDAFTDLKPVDMLDFGDFRQIVIGGYGDCEADNRCAVFGVSSGNAKKLVTAFGFVKSNCFLVSYSQRRAFGILYYDTAANEYITIPRMEITKDVISQMTSASDILEKLEAAKQVYVIGNYYYTFEYDTDNYEVWIYSDGNFIKPEEPVAMSYYDYDGPNAGNFDIAAALNSMKKSAE